MDLRKRLKKHMKTLEDFGLHIDPITRLPYVLENQTELQQERNKYDVPAQTILYNDLTLRFPPNTEQQEAYDVIFNAIDTADDTDSQKFICLHGAAGTGKSIVGQTVAAKLRSQGYLVSICASTTLAATNYENADTAHALFGYDVREDDDEFDGETEQECKLDTAPYAERMELLQETRLIIWDEAFGNHTKLLEAAVRALAANKKLVWLIIGDTRQTLPVIQYGTPEDIIGATITSSLLWARFTVIFLQENKRLTSLQAGLTDHSTAEERESAASQLLYAQAILEIGEGRCDSEFMCNVLERKTRSTTTHILALPRVHHYTTSEDDSKDAIEWLHPGNTLTNDSVRTKTILAVTNERVDFWNTAIQAINPNTPQVLLSHDYFADVDDPNGILASMLTEAVLNSYTNTQVPNHSLTLKKGDVCLITRPLKASDLASNSRVIISSICSKKLIKVVTLEQVPRILFIPRMRFKFHLQHKSSYNMTRVQFPLRLCYSMTTNKSQGQSFDQILLDLSTDSFSHGQAYVAASRVRRYDKIRLIVRPDMLMEYDTVEAVSTIPMIVNTVFPSVIQRKL